MKVNGFHYSKKYELFLYEHVINILIYLEIALNYYIMAEYEKNTVLGFNLHINPSVYILIINTDNSII